MAKTTIVKKTAKQYREEQLAADSIFFEMANDSERELSFEEREFLLHIGRLDENGRTTIKFQIERNVGRASRILKERSRAGLNGGYQEAQERCAEIQASHPALISEKKAQLAEIQRELTNLELELENAPTRVEFMETARESLTSIELCPGYAWDESNQKIRILREGSLAAKRRELKRGLLDAKKILEINAGPASTRESFMKNTPGLSRVVVGTNQSGERTTQVVFNESEWQETVKKAESDIVELQEELDAVQVQYDAEMAKAMEPRNFWLADTLPID